MPPAATSERADALVRTAILAAFQQDLPRYQGIARALAAPDDGQWVRLVDRALTDLLHQAVGEAWLRGWQPADLFRWASRHGGTVHAELLRAVVAADLDRHAPATVAARWHAQLAAAGATVWWEPQLSAVQACARTHPDRLALVDAAVSLLRSLGSLPALERLDPLPGTAAPAATDGERPEVDERILGRVRAFLAKAESTPYPAEAETFTAAAQALIARHAIDHALLAADRQRDGGRGSGRPDGAGGRRIGIDSPYENPKVALLDAIATANRCRTVWSKGLGFVTVVGFPPDLDAVELVFTSLLVQATAAMTRAGQGSAAGTRARSRSFRTSFLFSYAARIGERLGQATREQTEAAAAGPDGDRLLPVLRARIEAVDDALQAMFPEVRTTAFRSATDSLGWAGGRAAADLAVLDPATPLPS